MKLYPNSRILCRKQLNINSWRVYLSLCVAFDCEADTVTLIYTIRLPFQVKDLLKKFRFSNAQSNSDRLLRSDMSWAKKDVAVPSAASEKAIERFITFEGGAYAFFTGALIGAGNC